MHFLIGLQVGPTRACRDVTNQNGTRPASHVAFADWGRYGLCRDGDEKQKTTVPEILETIRQRLILFTNDFFLFSGVTNPSVTTDYSY